MAKWRGYFRPMHSPSPGAANPATVDRVLREVCEAGHEGFKWSVLVCPVCGLERSKW